MRSFFFSLFAVAVALVSAPLAAAQTIGGPIQVRTGDVFTVEVEYTQSMEVGEQDYSARITQVYAVQVLSAETRMWRFTPVTFNYELANMPGLEAQTSSINWPAISDAMSAMVRMATDVGFECRVDEHGRCTEMTNWPFWSTRVENFVLMMDGIARAMPQNAAAEEEVAAPEGVRPPKYMGGEADGEAVPTPSWARMRGPVLQGVARLIDNVDSRDAAAGMAWVYLPAFVQGRALNRRGETNFTDEYDMPFGAPPLRYTGTIRVERVNTRDNTAIVVRRATLDQASARESLRAMTEFVSEAMAPVAAAYGTDEVPTGTDIAQMMDAMLGDLAYEETTRGVIDLSTGLARETTTEFTVTARMTGSETPMLTRGRIVTRVRSGAPEAPRLPRG